MGVWIRSQNKVVLIRADDMWVDGEAIFANYIGDRQTWLGDYDSEAEAMHVLDMIQEYINNLAYVQYADGNVEFIPPVFQMPPAGFSKEG